MGSGLLEPRPYQREALKAIEGAHNRGMQRPAVVMATGLGKTVVFAHLVKRRHERPYLQAGRRTLVIAHRSELIDQAVDKIRDVAPGLSVGIVKAERNETRADVVVASVQTLQSEARRRMIADVGLIIIDECHRAVAPSYLAVLRHYGAWGDGPPVGQDVRAVAVGFTATLGERSDGKAHGDVWQDVVFVMGVSEGVRAGFLCRPRGIRVRVDDLDLANVAKTRGDYQKGDLGRAVEESMAPEAIAKSILEHADMGDPGLIFTPTVASARVVNDAVVAAGLRSEVAWGAMGQTARESVVERYKAGDLDWMVNASLFTEGTDLPRAKVAVIARPTRSATLLVQMAGRVLRPYRNPLTGVAKSEALLLFVDGRTSGYSLNAGITLFGEESAGIREHDETDDDELAGEELLGDLGLGEPVERQTLSGLNGPLVSEEVDLFGSSSSAWLRTRGGIWFLPAGERLIALIPGVEVGTWDVTSMVTAQHPTVGPDGRMVGTGRWVATGVHELSYAMAWAEADVTATEKTTAARAKAWRKDKPSDAQRNYARRFGYVVHDQMTKGEVSELISVGVASGRIDPYVPAYARGRS